jgi:hypothetical protein
MSELKAADSYTAKKHVLPTQDETAKNNLSIKIVQLKNQLQVAKMLEDIYNEPYTDDDFTDDDNDDDNVDPFVMQMLREPSLVDMRLGGGFSKERSMKLSKAFKKGSKLEHVLCKDHKSYDFDLSDAACHVVSSRALNPTYSDDEGEECYTQPQPGNHRPACRRPPRGVNPPTYSDDDDCNQTNPPSTETPDILSLRRLPSKEKVVQAA